MFQNLSPNRKRSKAGRLTSVEKKYAKTFLKKGYVVQDVAFVLNQGREKTVNQSVIQLLLKDESIKLVSDDELEVFLKIQSSYDPKTLLNPYKHPRLIRARESMLAAVQIFNSPTINFKAENFSVLANIAWTYLLHEKLEITNKGSSILPTGKSMTVSGILDKKISPIQDEAVKDNLKKIIKIRDAVEHTFFVGGDECFGPLFQACCVNFDRYMTEWFGGQMSLANELSLALQFVSLQKPQLVELEKSNLPKKIKTIYDEIQASEFSKNNAFQLNVYYTTELTSKTNADLYKLTTYDEKSYKGGADKVVIAVKKQHYKKLSQKDIIEKIRNKGYTKFSPWEHLQFWKQKWETVDERNNKAKKYGELVLQSQWLWYEQTWLPEVEEYCKISGSKFK